MYCDCYLYEQCNSAYSMVEADLNTTNFFGRVQPCIYELIDNIKTFNSPFHLLPLFHVAVLICYLCEATAMVPFFLMSKEH